MSNVRKVSINIGCFGCLLQVVGVLGLVYIVLHWDAIWAFVSR